MHRIQFNNDACFIQPAEWEKSWDNSQPSNHWHFFCAAFPVWQSGKIEITSWKCRIKQWVVPEMFLLFIINLSGLPQDPSKLYFWLVSPQRVSAKVTALCRDEPKLRSVEVLRYLRTLLSLTFKYCYLGLGGMFLMVFDDYVHRLSSCPILSCKAKTREEAAAQRSSWKLKMMKGRKARKKRA